MMRVVLWAVFTTLVAASGVLVLRACGTGVLLGWSRNFCPVPAQRQALKREIETGEGLRRQVHTAEMSLAQLPPCASPALPPPPPPPPPPALKVAPPPPQTNAIDESVKQRGGKNGRLQFTLIWHTLDDLDVEVTCPGGEINSFRGHRGPGICGEGVKDLDANGSLKHNVSSNPVENIVWEHAFPEGAYQVRVFEYMAKLNRPNSVPFTLRMRYGDQERVCTGAVTYNTCSGRGARDSVGEIGGTQVSADWTSGTDLPTCEELTTQLTHCTGPDK